MHGNKSTPKKDLNLSFMLALLLLKSKWSIKVSKPTDSKESS